MPGLLLLTALVLSFLSCGGIYSCIEMLDQYAGVQMGNEATGFFQITLLGTIAVTILAILSWIWVVKLFKK